jgi:drug/metabolite transporter (DMT)-like permease
MWSTASRQSPAADEGAARLRLVLLLMVVIWGINFPVAKAAIAELPPLVFNALRFPMAGLTLYIALRARGRITMPDRADRLRILLLGILGNVCYQQFFIFGLDITRAGTASVLLAATPIITAVFSAAAGHERVGARTWAGVVATFLGIILVVAAGGSARDVGGSTLLGDMLMLGGSISWAVYTVGSRNLIVRYGALQFTAWTLWIGTAGLLLIGAPDLLRTDLGAVSAAAWAATAYAGALSIGVAYLIWYHGVLHLGNTRTSAYSNLVPVVALLAAWVQLGEVPTAGQVAGAAVIIGGVSLAQVRGARLLRT